MDRLKLAWYALVCLSAGLNLVSGCGAEAPGQTGAARESAAVAEPPLVVAIRPAETDVQQTLTLAGSIEPYERAALHARVSGYLERLHVDIGDFVTAGQVLAELSVPEEESRLQRAEAVAVRARASGDLAEATHGRMLALRGKEPGAVSEQDLDVAAAELEVARAEMKVAEAEVAGLRSILAYATLRAPFGGTVATRSYDVGALIAAGDLGGPPVLEIVRTDRVRLVFDVPDVIAVHVEPGQVVEFTLAAFPAETFRGEISRCANTLRASTRTMRVEVDLDSRNGKLRPGLFATVRFAYRNIPGALTLPASVLRLADGEVAVFTVVDGSVSRVPVTILQDSGAEVRGDLDPTVPVVLSGPSRLAEGQAVRVRWNGGAEQ